MAEEDTAAEEVAETDSTGADKGQPAEKAFTQADMDRVISERVARERAKFADYADLKKKAASAMTEQERAVSEAEQRGRSAALKESGSRLALAEFRTAASEVGLNKQALEGFLEYAEMTRFVGDDGEPDIKAIGMAVKKIAGPKNTTNYDGGARSSAAPPTDMNALIRRAAGLE